jgi:hypothetical protein
MALFAAALTWIALIARTDLPYADLVGPLVLVGVGVSVRPESKEIRLRAELTR